MAALRAHQVTIRGKKMWKVELSASAMGQRVRVFRATEARAVSAARAALEERNRFGGELREVSVEQRAFLLEWERKGVGLDEMKVAVGEWFARRGEVWTVARVVTEFMGRIEGARASLSASHRSNLKSRVRPFVEVFGPRPLESVTAGEIEDFLSAQGESAPNYFRVIRQVLRFADRHGWLRVNPLHKLEAPTLPARVKDVLTPAQLRKAMRVVAGVEPGVLLDTGGKPVVGRYEPLLLEIVFGGLSGLRAAEVKRLEWSDVDLGAGATGEIHVRKMKTARSGVAERYVALTPAARAWLEWLGLKGRVGRVIAVNAKNLGIHRRRMTRAMGLTAWPHNALRRSFGSYHMAAFENAALTAEIMGHTDAKTTKAKYRVARRKEVAVEWFGLTPGEVMD